MKTNDHYEKTSDFHRISAVEKSGYYDAMIGGRSLKHTPYQLRVRKLILNILDTLLHDHPDISRACDAGCGRGDFAIEISKRYPQLNRVFGCDFVKEALTIAKKEAPADKNLSFQNAHLLHLPYGYNSFDLTLCINVLHHIYVDDLGKAIAELARVTSKFIILEIKNINNFLYRYLLPKSLLGMNVYPTSISNVNNIMRKHNFLPVDHRAIFLFKWLSPLVILVYKREPQNPPD
jgi:SAM-dependent methyltransferase